MVRDTLPSLNGIGGGYLGGYEADTLDMGNAHSGMSGGHTGMLYGDAAAGTDQAQLFGVGSALK